MMAWLGGYGWRGVHHDVCTQCGSPPGPFLENSVDSQRCRCMPFPQRETSRFLLNNKKHPHFTSTSQSSPSTFRPPKNSNSITISRPSPLPSSYLLSTYAPVQHDVTSTALTIVLILLRQIQTRVKSIHKALSSPSIEPQKASDPKTTHHPSFSHDGLPRPHSIHSIESVSTPFAHTICNPHPQNPLLIHLHP